MGVQSILDPFWDETMKALEHILHALMGVLILVMLPACAEGPQVTSISDCRAVLKWFNKHVVLGYRIIHADPRETGAGSYETTGYTCGISVYTSACRARG